MKLRACLRRTIGLIGIHPPEQSIQTCGDILEFSNIRPYLKQPCHGSVPSAGEQPQIGHVAEAVQDLQRVFLAKVHHLAAGNDNTCERSVIKGDVMDRGLDGHHLCASRQERCPSRISIRYTQTQEDSTHICGDQQHHKPQKHITKKS